MLTGASLSEVQEVGLQMLMILDQRRDATRFVEDLRARMAAARPDKIQALFPEWFPGQQPAEPGEVDIDKIDDSQVEWSVPPPAAREELDRWIASHSSGFVSAADLGEGDWQ